MAAIAEDRQHKRENPSTHSPCGMARVVQSQRQEQQSARLWLATGPRLCRDRRGYGSERRDLWQRTRGRETRDRASRTRMREWLQRSAPSQHRRDYGSDRPPPPPPPGPPADYAAIAADYGSDRTETGTRATRLRARIAREWLQSPAPEQQSRETCSDRAADYGSSERDENPSTAQSVQEWRGVATSQRQGKIGGDMV